MQLNKSLILVTVLLSSFTFMGCPKPAEVTPAESAKPAETVKPSETPASSVATPTPTPTPSSGGSSGTSTSPTPMPTASNLNPTSTPTPSPSSSTTTTIVLPTISELLGKSYSGDFTLSGGGNIKGVITYDALNQISVLVNFSGTDERPSSFEALDNDGNSLGRTSGYNLTPFTGNVQFNLNNIKFVSKLRFVYKGTNYEIVFTKDPKMSVIKPAPTPNESTNNSSSGGSSPVLNPTPVPLKGSIGTSV